MQLFNILTSVQIPVYGQTFDVSLGVIGQLIRWLINGIGIVGVGIIVFSLLLKLIVLHRRKRLRYGGYISPAKC